MRFRSLSVHRASVWLELPTMSLARGVNVVVGDNESGKTTLSRTDEALLFGPTPETIAPLTSEAAFHVSAEVECTDGDEPLTLRRRGHALELSVPNATLEALLSPANRARFRDLFRIGHADLKRGGSFLEERGSLGHLLFAAQSGGDPAALAALESQLEKRCKEAKSGKTASDGLRKHLSTYKEVYAKHDAEARFRAHDEQCEKRQRCEQDIAREGRTLRDIDAKLAVKRALLEGHTHHREHEAADARLRDIESAGPTPDLKWASDASTVLAKMTDAHTELDAARDAHRQAEAARDASPMPSPIAPFAGEIQALASETSAHEQRQKQLANAQAMAQKATVALIRLLDGLDPDHGSLGAPRAAAAQLLSAPKPVKKVRSLLVEGQELDHTLTSHREQLAKAVVTRERTVAQAAAEAPRPCEDLEVARGLAVSLSKIRESAQTAHDELERKRRSTKRLRASLGLSGNGAAASLPVADEGTLDKAARARDAAGQLARELATSQAKLEAKLADTEKRLAAMRAELGAAPSAEALASTRAERDGAWTDLRGVWFPSLAADAAAQLPLLGARFQERQVAADACTDARFADAKRLGEVDALHAECEAQRAELARLIDERAAAKQVLADAETRWSSLWSFLPEPPAKWPVWRSDWIKLCEALDELKAGEDGHAQLLDQRRARDAALAPMLQAHAPRLLPLLEVDELENELELELASRRKHNRGVDKAQDAAQRALDAEEDAGRRVQAAIADVAAWEERWLAALEDVPESIRDDRAAVARWIEAQTALALHAKDLDERADEVGELIGENVKFAACVRDLVARVRVVDATIAVPEGLSDQDALRELERLAKIASARADARAKAEETLEQRCAQLKQRATLFAERAEVLRRHCAQGGLAEDATVAEVEAAIERAKAADEVRRAIANLEPVLAKLWPMGTAAALAEGDEDALRNAIVLLEAEHNLHADLRDEAVGERKLTDAELAKLEAAHGGEALAQSLAYARAQVAAAAEEALHVEAALHLVKAARQRATERGRALIAEASALFSELTEGEYTGLEIDRTGKEPTLLALPASGLVKDVRVLSDGTADQIWFALRLAAVRAAVKETPFPLVLDDVLVHFDARRKRAALKVLGRLAEELQVILFTHDDFVAHLAKEVLGEGVNFAMMSRPEFDPLAGEPVLERPPAPRAVLDEPAPVRAHQPSTLEAGCRYVLEVLEGRDHPLNKGELCEEVRDRHGVDLTPTWPAVISRLRERELVTQFGEKRGARYALAGASAA